MIDANLEERRVKLSNAQNKVGGEIMNPYLLYEMAIGGGCTEAEAKREMQLYCLEVGLDPHCP